MTAGTSTQARPLSWLQPFRRPPVPASPPLQGWRDAATQAGLAALGCVLPFSSAGVAVMLGLLLLLALCSVGTIRRTEAWREPTAAIGLLLFAYIALHTALYGPWTPASLSAVNKYHELLLFPMLLALVGSTSRPQAFMWGLTAGSLGYALAHWISPWLPALAEELAAKRISAGFCLAVSAYLLLHEKGRNAWLWRGIAALLALTVVTRIEGRTGHVVLLLLAMWTVWRVAPRRWRVPAAISAGLAVVLLAMASPPVQNRIKETWNGVASMRLNAGTSTSIRLALLTNGWTVAKEHQPLGVGYGRYAEFHEPVARQRMAREPDWKPENASWAVLSNNPHNEYLMQLASGGLPALALFLAWLAAPLLRRDPDGRARLALVGVTIAFAFACLFNSLLLDFVEGHYYMAVLAFLLARERRAAAPPPTA
jgi:O-antigen ligase